MNTNMCVVQDKGVTVKYTTLCVDRGKK